ncbi:MAG: TolC family protein [Alphaproteobacteria bacterium]|nr:TolC family protein [Alphaproteobacteria bacterium]
MKNIFIAASMVLCAAATNAMELSLERAVEMIAAESQDLKKAEFNVSRARSGLDSVKSNRRPQISASATYMNIINVENPGRPLGFDLSGFGDDLPDGVPAFIEFPDNIGIAGLSINQPIYTFGRIGNAADAAHHAISGARSGSELAKREIRAAAAQIYWTARMTDEIVRIADKNLKSSKDAERRLTDAGRANRSNLVKILADIAAKEIALSDAEFNRDSAHRLLKIMAGIEEAAPLNLTDNFPKRFEHLTVAQELTRNPEWDMLEAQARMQMSQAAARASENRPVLGATASYNYVMMHTEPGVWRGNDSQSAMVGLSLQIPLFDGGQARANSRMDRLAAEATRQDLDKSRRMKMNEYRDALLNHERLLANLDKLDRAHDLAERAVQISMDRFAAGQTSAVELSDVQSALMQMDMAVIGAKFNIIMAEEAIRKLSGETNE